MNSLNEERLYDKGFKKVGSYFVGIVQGGYFTVQDTANSGEVLISFGTENCENKGQLFAFLDEFVKKETVSKYEMDDAGVKVFYSEKEMSDIGYFIGELANKMQELEMKCVCSNCEHTDGLAFYSNGVVPLLLCDECGASVINRVEEDRNAKNNYLKGFLFALIGALIGSIAWIVLGVIGFYASIAGYAIAAAAFAGYKKAKGKLNGGGVAIVIIAIILGFVFAEFVGLYISFRKEISKTMSIADFFAILAMIVPEWEFLKSLLLDLTIGLLFAGLGTYNIIGKNIRAAKAQKNFKVEKILPLDD